MLIERAWKIFHTVQPRLLFDLSNFVRALYDAVGDEHKNSDAKLDNIRCNIEAVRVRI